MFLQLARKLQLYNVENVNSPGSCFCGFGDQVENKNFIPKQLEMIHLDVTPSVLRVEMIYRSATPEICVRGTTCAEQKHDLGNQTEALVQHRHFTP